MGDTKIRRIGDHLHIDAGEDGVFAAPISQVSIGPQFMGNIIIGKVMVEMGNWNIVVSDWTAEEILDVMYETEEDDG